MTVPYIRGPVIPNGSTVVVTGCSGFIGSHVVDQVLTAGYRVRGTSRDANKHQWLKDCFDKKYGQGRFELATVPVQTEGNEFEEAVKGTVL